MEERIVPYCYSRVIILIVLFVAVWQTGMAEEECMNDDGNPVEYCKPCSTEDGRQYISGPAQAVYCYECDSRTDIRCADPFNFTLNQRDLPQLERCEGCCVKNVRMKGTPYESVWRTCTQKIQINLFIVDHVCMYESNSAGILCFCEEDYCNSTTNIVSTQLSLLGAFVLVLFTIKAYPWLIL